MAGDPGKLFLAMNTFFYPSRQTLSEKYEVTHISSLVLTPKPNQSSLFRNPIVILK